MKLFSKTTRDRILYYLYSQKNPVSDTQTLSDAISLNHNTVRVNIFRLRVEGLINSKWLQLTPEGKAYIESKIKEYKKTQKHEKETKNLIESVEEKAERISDLISQYLESNHDWVYQSLSKGRIVISIYGEYAPSLLAFSPKLVDALLESFDDVRTLFENHLEALSSEWFQSKKVSLAFVNGPKKMINDISESDIGKLFTYECEVKNRSETYFTVNSITYKCSVCGHTETRLSLDSLKPRAPAFCPVCGKKKTMKKIKAERSISLKLIVGDIFNLLTNGSVPATIPVVIEGNICDFKMIMEGERLKITGIVKSVSDPKHPKSAEEFKVIKAVGVEKLNEQYSLTQINDSELVQLKEIAKNPLTQYVRVVGEGLVGIDYQVKIGILSLFGDLSLLFLGDKGTGKSELAKRIAELSLRSKYTPTITSTPAGLIGAVIQNKFTGSYSITGGVLRRLHPNGILAIDEFNRDENHRIQDIFFSLLQDKLLITTKANVEVRIPCDIKVIATANPIMGYDKFSSKKENEFFGIVEPIWDRFAFKVFFPVAPDLSKGHYVSEKLMSKSHTTFNVPDSKLILLKKYQIYAYNQVPKVELNKHAAQTLEAISQEHYFNKISSQSFRHVNHLFHLLEGICRIRLHKIPDENDFKTMIDILDNLIIAHELYKQNKQMEE